MKKLFAIFLMCVTLTACRTGEERFAWAADFCGGKDKISIYKSGNNSDFVVCKDNRYSDVPNTF